MSLIDYRLVSFHEKYVGTARKYVTQVRELRDTSNITLMIDSGAFTAWRRKEKDIEVKTLCDLLRKAFKNCGQGQFKEVFAISLDKIPGIFGTTPSPEEVREAIRISDENHHILTSEFGNRILPVYHQGEPLSRLHEVLALNSEYVCISPRNDIHEKERREWAQRIHQEIQKLVPNGIRTHGLAVTGGMAMEETGWFSVDSAAIIQGAAFGKMFILHNNKLVLINVSEHSSFKRKRGSHHHWNDPTVKRTVQYYLDKAGVTIEECQTEGGARELVNAVALLEGAARMYRETLVPQTLFAP
jgi:hypothetical protein